MTRRKRLRRALSVLAVGLAVAVPTAQARPVDGAWQKHGVVAAKVQPRPLDTSAWSRSIMSVDSSRSWPATSPTAGGTGSSFDWRDAAIGAAVASGLIVLLRVTVPRVRPRRPAAA
jgi:hypothetical protein